VHRGWSGPKAWMVPPERVYDPVATEDSSDFVPSNHDDSN
jgi:hypothetical protein